MKIGIFSRHRGTEPSFEELVAPHMERLYRLAYRYVGNQADAEDLIQDLLIKLVPRVDELRKIEQPYPWLVKVLYRLHIDRFRKSSRNPVDGGYDEHIDRAVEANSGDMSPARVGLIRDLQSALAQLSEEQRALIVMHDMESYTLAELEKILDTPIGTLKSRLHRSRAKLRKLLEEGTVSLQRAC